MTPAQALATALGAIIREDGTLLAPGGIVYVAPTGKVRLDHRGHIHTLGTWSDPTDVLAAAYRSIVGAGVGA